MIVEASWPSAHTSHASALTPWCCTHGDIPRASVLTDMKCARVAQNATRYPTPMRKHSSELSLSRAHAMHTSKHIDKVVSCSYR